MQSTIDLGVTPRPFLPRPRAARAAREHGAGGRRAARRTPKAAEHGPRGGNSTNGNRSQVAFDELGMVVKTAVLGNTTESLGDTLTDPTTTLEYELFRWKDEGKPNFVKTAVRETHGDSETRWLESFTYSDGSGRVVMTKVSAEPGLAPELDGNGDPVYVDDELQWEEADPRYVGTGRAVFDNKGNVVRQYEPFFSATSEYEDDEDLVQWGVTPLFDYDPVGRLVRTDFPDGSFATTARTAWKEVARDRNDNVEDSEWHEVRKSTHTPTPSAQDQRAATLTLAHKDTPTESHLDVLGRPFQVDEMLAAGAPPTLITTKTQLDIQGNPLAVIDAFGRTAMAYVYGMLGQMLQQTSIDSGSRRMVQAVDGQPVRRWDDRDQTLRSLYDDLRRPTELHLTVGMASEILVEKTEYGEAETDPEDDNLRGKVFRQYDGAGAVTMPSYDFKGNPLETTRQLAVGYAVQPDWGSATLETETFDTLFEYDALNRPTSVTTPDASETLPAYNEAGLLESVGVKIRGAGSATAFVDDIDYNEKGQRVLCDHGNGTISEYEYDELTFRVRRIKTTRTSDSAILQNLFYTYDPIGNIVEITDAAQQTVYFDNDVVSPTQKFEYDALYRLTSAEGREHAGGIADDIRDEQDLPIHNLPHANMSGAVRLYEETYEYDVVGNLMKMIHSAGSPGSWTRFYDYAPVSGTPPTNRLRSSSDSGDTLGVVPYAYAYSYDAHGNCTSMPHLATIEYDFKDQMREADKGGGGTVYFTYDAGGQRVRKVWEHSGYRDERIYVGGMFEVWRRTIISTESLEEERQTLHVMDGAKRVAMVETLTWEDEDELTSPTPRLRYQLSNHIDTTHTEVDASGNVFSYEEFHPWGTSAYRSGDSSYDVSPRRYRYTGKERDEATGLDYHGLRYKVHWLGRWSTADPLGLVDGPNLYAYVKNNPIGLRDPTGGQSKNYVQWDEDTIEHVPSGDVLHRGEGYTEVYNETQLDRQEVVFGDDLLLHSLDKSAPASSKPSKPAQATPLAADESAVPFDPQEGNVVAKWLLYQPDSPVLDALTNESNLQTAQDVAFGTAVIAGGVASGGIILKAAAAAGLGATAAGAVSGGATGALSLGANSAYEGRVPTAGEAAVAIGGGAVLGGAAGAAGKLLTPADDLAAAGGGAAKPAAGEAGGAVAGGASTGAGTAPQLAKGASFGSFEEFKAAAGPAGPNMQWHHIIEQTEGNVTRFGATVIHNTGNLVRVSTPVHQQISAFYGTKFDWTNGMTVRQYLSSMSAAEQQEFGRQVLTMFGVLR